MSSQLQDYFEEAVETVARRVYARNRTPSDKRWENTHPEIQRRLIHDVRTVIDLWLREALGDLLAEARDLRAGWKCEGCGTTDASRRYDNGEACDECVHRAFGESG